MTIHPCFGTKGSTKLGTLELTFEDGKTTLSDNLPGWNEKVLRKYPHTKVFSMKAYHSIIHTVKAAGLRRKGIDKLKYLQYRYFHTCYLYDPKRTFHQCDNVNCL